jgi:OmcA/MtrC family decaheme c-type cytochrome
LYVNGVLQANLINPGIYQITLDQTEPITPGTQGSGAVSFEGKGSRDGLNLPITSAVDFFPITDATASTRRQKVDLARCNECHEMLTQHGENRNDNLDNCLICHNPPAWNPARSRSLDMALMTHRLHLEGRYPQPISNCKSCHTDTGFYPAPANSGILAKSTSTGDNNTDPTDDSYITPNSATCSVACHNGEATRDHMEQFGGVFDAFLNNSGEYESESSGTIANEICTFCHEAGASHDVARVHALD